MHWNIDFVTESYHGGRNEQFWFGPSFEALWNDYDLSSAYPSAMALIGMPDWDNVDSIKSLKKLLELPPQSLAFADVDFEFPETVRYPVLPVRTDNGIIFPRSGNSNAALCEIQLAYRLGAKIKINEARYVPTDLDKPIFGKFIKYCIDKRSLYAKGTVKNLFWKELANSTYGKTAQGLRDRRVYDLKAEGTKKLDPSKITNPFFASFISAFCRATLAEIMNALPADVCIFSVTTDGFLTDATDEQMEAATKGELCKLYSYAREFLTGEETIYETKHKVRKLLGWRTRGQATLEPSTTEDWSYSSGENDRVVLAKAGIKLMETFTKLEDNDEIIKLFFNREPEHRIEATIGAGIREMYEDGIDFGDKHISKRLSMEFDWKRSPLAAGDVNLLLPDGSAASHLFFSTKPWKSVSDFINMRLVWDEYNNDGYQCLKSLSDYMRFAKYADSKLSLGFETAKYLKKKNGSMIRLRRELITAWRHGKAGTKKFERSAYNMNLPPKKKLTASKFAQLLSNSRIPCSKGDVDNGRKITEFIPYQVPDTEETRKALETLQYNVFPYLQPDKFLAKKSQLDLQNVDIGKCQFARKMQD